MMTPEQKAAYVVAQAALLLSEVAQMQAFNQFKPDHLQGYGESSFENKIHEYQQIIGHNALMELFRE